MAAVLCLGVVCLVFFGDMWIKNRAERTLTERKTVKKAGGFLLLHRYHNRGAMLGMGRRRSRLVAALSAGLTLLAAALLLFSLGRKGNNLLRAGLALLLGGAFSNTYDRLKRKYVVDYVSFNVPWKHLKNIVFNVSDFCIMIGALLAALGWEE